MREIADRLGYALVALRVVRPDPPSRSTAAPSASACRCGPATLRPQSLGQGTLRSPTRLSSNAAVGVDAREPVDRPGRASYGHGNYAHVIRTCPLRPRRHSGRPHGPFGTQSADHQAISILVQQSLPGAGVASKSTSGEMRNSNAVHEPEPPAPPPVRRADFWLGLPAFPDTRRSESGDGAEDDRGARMAPSSRRPFRCAEDDDATVAGYRRRPALILVGVRMRHRQQPGP